MAMEELGYKSPEGCIAHGLARQVISGQAGTTKVLKASDSGSLCLFDNAAGQIYTLPAPVVGLQFDFMVTVAGTSGSYSVDTDAATTFIGGGLGTFAQTVAEGGDSFAATISSTVSIDLDSDLTGRLVGTYFSLICLSSTTWGVGGTTHGEGTLATPFA